MAWAKLFTMLAISILAAEAFIKRPDPQLGLPKYPQKHTKNEEETFLSKFRKWDTNKMGKVDGDLASPFLGHGGTYESVQPLTSKAKTIEADHVPHYSILDYLNIDKVDPKDLPENLRKVVEKRKSLQDELMQTDYPKNEEKLKGLKEAKDSLHAELNKPIRLNQWDQSLHAQFISNINEIKMLERETASSKQDLLQTPDMELKEAEKQNRVNQLIKENTELRRMVDEAFQTPEKRIKLEELDAEYMKLKKVNQKLSKALDDHEINIKKAMGVISIPYDMHRLFPSTGNAGLDAKIRGLKNADAGAAKLTMEQYDKAWTSSMDEGIKKGYFKDVESFSLKSSDGKFLLDSNGKKTYDYQKLWEANFDMTIGQAQRNKDVTFGPSKSAKGNNHPPPTAQEVKSAYMKGLHETYAKKFMTTAIYYVKTPREGYSRLFNLYVSEYKLHLKNNFDSCKLGMSSLLEANKDFGWLTGKEVLKLQNEHKLLDMDLDPSGSTAGAKKVNQWKSVEELIKLKADKSDNPLIPDKISAAGADANDDISSSTAAGKVCTSSSRRKRSAAADGCIFVSKRHEDADIESDQRKRPAVNMDQDLKNVRHADVDILENKQNVKPKQDDADLDDSNRKGKTVEDLDPPKLKPNLEASELDSMPKPSIHLPSDSDIISIDSKRLNTYLSQSEDGDFDSIRTKESIVEYATKNSDKLTGSPEDIAKTKALLKQENLEGHSQQTTLARKVLQTHGDSISPKTLSKYQKVKVSASQFATKAESFTSKSGKFAKSYGKIMLTKGIVTALRHGDYESLALMGGRIGLEVALQGMKKLGKQIAKKATTKFMTKLASQMTVLGKMAGPIGDIADIGINIFSLTKSVKILNDPRASRFDQNDAIADITADAIDIGFTAAAAVASLIIPPLAPVFAVVVFIVNLFTTIAVAFYKASNHVDRLNNQIPLLDYERKTEYWRFVGGKDISGYIQELIDTKRANNIAVNVTVQFLVNNPDFTGRVFPSRTLHKPETDCSLQGQSCANLFHFIPLPCDDWEHLSNCDGAGGYCEGRYSDWRCQSNSGTGLVVPLAVHKNMEYRCRCGSEKPPVWGYEILDNEVDFRYTQSVYLERAAPDFAVPSGFNYLCKPSSRYNEGKRVSNPFTTTAYLCKGAIGIQRSRSGGKYMMYDLGRGSDRVELDDSERVDNLFIVKDGHKVFYGNGGDDTFVIDGPCHSLTGQLDGRSYRDQGNSLVLGQSCSRDRTVVVDMTESRIQFGSGTGSFRLYGIERVIGRKQMTDKIVPRCSAKLVAGGGGSSTYEPDVIILPSCFDSFELTVSVEGNTFLDATNFSRGKVVVLLRGQQGFRSKVPMSFGGTLHFKFESNVGTLNSANVDIVASAITLGFSNGGSSRFEFIGSAQSFSSGSCDSQKHEHNQISLSLSENSKFSRQIIYNLKIGQVQCYYRLEGEPLVSSIYGYDFIDNVFQLRSGSWSAHGGRLNNQFILMSSEFSGTIDGRSGQSSLYLVLSDINRLEINLSLGIIRGRGTIEIRNILNVIGRQSYIDHVVTACNTKSLDLGGPALDFVEIPSSSCTIQLTIAARGRMVIVDRKWDGVTTIQAGYDNKMDDCSKTATIALDLSISNEGGGQTVLLLNFPIYKLSTATTGGLGIDGNGHVSLNGKFPSIQFEEDHGLKSVLVLEGDKLLGYHDLNSVWFRNEPKVRMGSNADGLQNVFKLGEGVNWNVVGGKGEDTFFLESNTFGGNIDGGFDKNSLFIGSDITGNIVIGSNEVWIQGTKSISFHNIQKIHGRSGQPEKMTVDCGMKYVGMNGGSSDNYDHITVPNLDCKPKLTIVGVGYTELESLAEQGTFDIYLQSDDANNLKIKLDLFVVNSTIFNIPIQSPAYKLSSYNLKIGEESNFKVIRLDLKFSHNQNFIEFNQRLKLDGTGTLQTQQNVNMMFTDDDFISIGNILINSETNELNILHVLQDSAHEDDLMTIRRGAVGASNVFRLHTGNWEAFGGTLDDSFILNEDSFRGKIHGLGGTNSLILKDSIEAKQIVVNLPENNLTLHYNNASTSSISVNSIQIVGGRKLKEEKVICGCDTTLVMLEGGSSSEGQDLIEIHESFCQPKISFVVAEFTQLENNALAGHFTYHVRTTINFEIKYFPTNETRHAFKFEIPLEYVKNVSMETTKLEILFENGSKVFPLNFYNTPTFQIVQGKELVAELKLEEGRIPQSSIIARAPFSGSIYGLNGAENGIIVNTSDSTSLKSIIGKDKDDNIFLSRVHSILLVNGKGGINRLQLSDELHQDKELEVDFNLEKITFIEDHSSFITIMRGVTLFAGRETGFERVILGCETTSVKFADEVIVRKNCGYNVRINIGTGTRVIFDITEDHHNQLDDEFDVTDDVEGDDVATEEEAEFREALPEDERSEKVEEVDEEEVPIGLLASSKFYYHFSSIHSFDIEVDTFSRLSQTRHIFYLNFTLSDLSSIRFSLNSSRLIYSTSELHELEYSHLVGEVDPSAMFYSQPEFMTGEGFLLRISRYGEIIAVVANTEEILGLDEIQHVIIPRLSEYSSKLGISFMLETQSDFIYCGSPTEIGLLSNRENITSHLVGFNQSTYEILDLDEDVFIYPQSVGETSVHVLDLTSIVSQIRNRTEHKYVPVVEQVGDDFVIQMQNWTDIFGRGSVILVNGTFYPKAIKILLNSIAMEILPSLARSENRTKRSINDGEEQIWGIQPRPIFIPEGHVYLFAAEDLEDGVEIRSGPESENSSFEYSKNENDLIITSTNAEEIEAGKVTTFAIFDYFSPASTSTVVDSEDGEDNEKVSFGKLETVNNIQIRLGRETININSNEPLVTEDGEEISVGFYEDILDREEAKITEDFPDIPRKFKVPLMQKIGRTDEYRYMAWAILMCSIIMVGSIIWRYCRKKPQKGGYSVAKWQNTDNSSQAKNKEIIQLSEFYEENVEDYEEPILIQEIRLAEDM